MKACRILVLAIKGGVGSRLQPLTAERCKPAAPFGSRDRIVHFVLSSLINLGSYTNYLLVQYKSQSLIEHICKAWGISPCRVSSSLWYRPKGTTGLPTPPMRCGRV